MTQVKDKTIIYPRERAEAVNITLSSVIYGVGRGKHPCVKSSANC